MENTNRVPALTGPRKICRRVLGAGAALVAALLVACGGGETGGAAVAPLGSCGAADCGTAVLTIHDAAGDFLSYTVDVTSLKLVKADGATVETLPVSTRIDFAQLVDLSEVLSAGQIPAGRYRSAVLSVDFSNAAITAEDGSGNGVPLRPVNAAGASLTTLALTVNLNDAEAFNVLPNLRRQLAFDFNLAASNTVDFTGGTVTVAPMIYATTSPPSTAWIRARGLLTAVDTAGSSYTITVRPFRGNASLGSLLVHTTAATTFEINGTVSTGASGLSALSAFFNDPAVTDKITAAFGQLMTSDGTFTAARVRAGSSVGGGNVDLVSGQIVARSGNVLTIRGGTIDHRNGSWGYRHGAVSVTVAATTRVIREGRGEPVTIADLSVGQSVDVFGLLATASTTEDQMMPVLAMDATSGRVRMNVTSLWGRVTGKAAAQVTLDLAAIEGRPISLYDFTGTGSNPTAWRVNTTGLDTSGITVPAAARLFGFVAPFGMASSLGEDFRAVTLVDYSGVRDELFVVWPRGGSATALGSIGASLQVFTSDALIALVKSGPERVPLGGGVRIVPSASPTVFAIGHAGSRSVESFRAYGEFQARLSALKSGNPRPAVLVISASGTHDGSTVPATFTATRLLVGLAD